MAAITYAKSKEERETNMGIAIAIERYVARVRPCRTAAPVKDYRMPAVEQRLADCIDVWGRRRIMLRGGNRGVAADVSGLFRMSYGDLKCVRLRLCAWFDGFVHQACCFGRLHRQRESVFVAAERCLLVHLLF